jgi:hypothetical protein
LANGMSSEDAAEPIMPSSSLTRLLGRSLTGCVRGQ